MGNGEHESERYAAFISYRHVEPDRTWAQWLQRALEQYRVPRSLVAQGYRRRVGRVFLDEEELAASHDLSSAIEDALKNSSHLIVVCSPRTPGSLWVSREIERFRQMGRSDQVLALLIEGEPSVALPSALRTISESPIGDAAAREVEPLAADVRRHPGESLRTRRYTALLRTVAAVIGCRFDDLRRRAAARARRRRLLIGGLLSGLVLLFASIAVYALNQREEKATALTRVLRLSDARTLERLRQDEEALWPLHPDLTEEIDAWLLRARGIQERVSIHQEDLAALRARGTQDGPGGDWHFGSQGDAWMHDVLSALVSSLGELFEPDKGLVSRVTQRRNDGDRLRARTTERFRDLWSKSIEGIRTSPRYGGVHLEAQLGLTPLGPDPTSRLYEFAHWGSGSIPTRDGEGHLVLADDSAMVLVLIPAGSFLIGAQAVNEELPNFDTNALGAERGVARVTLTRPFFLGKFECTRGQWMAITATKPSKFQTGAAQHGPDLITDRHPLENVNWRALLRGLNRHRLTLPTECQWEYACRLGLPKAYAQRWAHGDLATLSLFANTADKRFGESNAPEGTFRDYLHDGFLVHAPVGTFLPDELGLYDMLGNVSELVLDIQPYTHLIGAAAIDPNRYAQVAAGHTRVSRGGAFDSLPEHVRCTMRSWPDAKDRSGTLGCRAACAVVGSRREIK